MYIRSYFGSRCIATLLEPDYIFRRGGGRGNPPPTSPPPTPPACHYSAPPQLLQPCPFYLSGQMILITFYVSKLICPGFCTSSSTTSQTIGPPQRTT